MSEYPQPEQPQQPQRPPQPQFDNPAPPYAAPAPLSDADARLWAMLAHLGVIVFGFLPPLIIWLVMRERSPFVDDQAKEALNFSILVTIAQIVSAILWVILIGIVLSIVVGVGTLVLCIIAGMAANRGESYRYPVPWRFVK